MYAKEEGIIHNLNEIADMQGEVAKEAMANGHMDTATLSLIIAKTATEAAEIIEKQAAELEVIRAQQTKENSPATNIGKRVRLAVADDKIYIIVAESKDQEKLLIKEISANPALEANKKEVRFID
ncbi:hypothetical protein ACRWFY_25830 [Escherichia coli]|uniref:hypothetical protein n=1 Tax=Escherichia coli TaxID=562 RepID=UPI0006A4A871|nr:hypothetical protein [Escherichia coli]EFL3997291.1 hypothetical protein [Escherichia coli]EFL4040263.1 hypothetical protein [Escherichia coli]EFL9937620.1 hypothetical protein [Escherichia coli]EFL9952439.1 hypothetical protein [Escherichia coli]EFM0064567.1 hypothetical protein [Escherichia coli]